MNENENHPKMIFDEDEQMFIPTSEFILEKTGINLNKVLKPGFIDNPQRRAEFFLRQIAADIYTYIFDCNFNNNWQRKILNGCKWFHENILHRVYLEQVMYTLSSGRSVLYSGQNFKNGQQMDRDEIIKAGISPRAEQLLNNQIPYLGHSIVFRGSVNRWG